MGRARGRGPNPRGWCSAPTLPRRGRKIHRSVGARVAQGHARGQSHQPGVGHGQGQRGGGRGRRRGGDQGQGQSLGVAGSRGHARPLVGGQGRDLGRGRAQGRDVRRRSVTVLGQNRGHGLRRNRKRVAGHLVNSTRWTKPYNGMLWFTLLRTNGRFFYIANF